MEHLADAALVRVGVPRALIGVVPRRAGLVRGVGVTHACTWDRGAVKMRSVLWRLYGRRRARAEWGGRARAGSGLSTRYIAGRTADAAPHVRLPVHRPDLDPTRRQSGRRPVQRHK